MSDFQDNISRPETWLRLIYMLLFALIFWVCKLVLLVLAVIQFLSLLLSGEKNEELDSFANSFSQYLGQVTAYLSLASDDRPFPFGEWPAAGPGDRDSSSKPTAESAPVKKEPAVVEKATPDTGGAAKTSPKKTTAKKKSKTSTKKTSSRKKSSKKKTGGKS